eukprot:840620-Rhodomonas_salina.2
MPEGASQPFNDPIFANGPCNRPPTHHPTIKSPTPIHPCMHPALRTFERAPVLILVVGEHERLLFLRRLQRRRACAHRLYLYPYATSVPVQIQPHTPPQDRTKGQRRKVAEFTLGDWSWCATTPGWQDPVQNESLSMSTCPIAPSYAAGQYGRGYDASVRSTGILQVSTTEAPRSTAECPYCGL